MASISHDKTTGTHTKGPFLMTEHQPTCHMNPMRCGYITGAFLLMLAFVLVQALLDGPHETLFGIVKATTAPVWWLLGLLVAENSENYLQWAIRGIVAYFALIGFVIGYGTARLINWRRTRHAQTND